MAHKEPKEKREQEIIDAAVHEFLDAGYEGTSLNSIARRAGLTKGGLYYHFGSKDDILRAANGRYTKPVYELIRHVSHMESPVAGIRTYIREYLTYWSSHGRELSFFFLSMAKVLSNSGIRHFIAEYGATMVDYFASLLQRGIEVGELKQHDIEALALSLTSALDGITVFLLSAEEFRVDRTAAQFERVFLHPILIDAE